MMKAIVFLDIDGVLNSSENEYELQSKGLPTTHDKIKIPDKMILRLKKILDETGAELVISSSWRNNIGCMHNLYNQLKEFDIKISGTTNTGTELDRGRCIVDYLIDTQSIDYAYICLDDHINDIKTYVPRDRIIYTNSYIGLTDEQVDEAIKKINTQKEEFRRAFFTNEKDEIYNTVDEARAAYTAYISTHIACVKYVAKNYGDYIIKTFFSLSDIDRVIDLNSNTLKYLVDSHDLSKYKDEEFEPYRLRFFKSKEDLISDEDIKKLFDKAWEHHYMNNPHHPEYYGLKSKRVCVRIDMPSKYIIEMFCDWIAMSLMRNQRLYDWWKESGCVKLEQYFSKYIFKMINDFIEITKDTFDFRVIK